MSNIELQTIFFHVIEQFFFSLGTLFLNVENAKISCPVTNSNKKIDSLCPLSSSSPLLWKIELNRVTELEFQITKSLWYKLRVNSATNYHIQFNQCIAINILIVPSNHRYQGEFHLSTKDKKEK